MSRARSCFFRQIWTADRLHACTLLDDHLTAFLASRSGLLVMRNDYCVLQQTTPEATRYSVTSTFITTCCVRVHATVCTCRPYLRAPLVDAHVYCHMQTFGRSLPMSRVRVCKWQTSEHCSFLNLSNGTSTP